MSLVPYPGQDASFQSLAAHQCGKGGHRVAGAGHPMSPTLSMGNQPWMLWRIQYRWPKSWWSRHLSLKATSPIFWRIWKAKVRWEYVEQWFLRSSGLISQLFSLIHLPERSAWISHPKTLGWLYTVHVPPCLFEPRFFSAVHVRHIPAAIFMIGASSTSEFCYNLIPPFCKCFELFGCCVFPFLFHISCWQWSNSLGLLHRSSTLVEQPPERKVRYQTIGTIILHIW